MTHEPPIGYAAPQREWLPAEPASGHGFSGYAGDAPSGLSYGVPHQPQAYAPPPQAAYPDPNPLPPPGERPAEQLPGYLQPYPPAAGFSGKGPSVGPVVVFTIFFGVFGLFPAMRRAKRAEAVGDSPGRYWMAWGITFALGWVVSVVATLVLIAFGVIAVAAASDSATAGTTHKVTAAELSRSMVDQGTYTGKGGKKSDIKSASCVVTSVDATGDGDYRCAVILADTTRATLLVRVDTDGWQIVGKTK